MYPSKSAKRKKCTGSKMTAGAAHVLMIDDGAVLCSSCVSTIS